MIITCKKCGREFDVDPDIVGNKVRCECGNTFLLSFPHKKVQRRDNFEPMDESTEQSDLSKSVAEMIRQQRISNKIMSDVREDTHKTRRMISVIYYLYLVSAVIMAIFFVVGLSKSCSKNEKSYSNYEPVRYR